MSGYLTGTGTLLKASARFDGRSFAPWIVIVTALSASSVIAYPVIFPSPEERVGLATAIGSNPALSIIFGRATNLLSADGFNAWRSLALGGLLAALGAIFAVTKGTRGQEDSGQAELLASSVMGRGTRLMSATLLALAGSLLLGLVAGVVTGLCGGSWETSLLLGATFTATGALFAAVAAVAAQLASDAHTANSISVSVFGVLFLFRGVFEALQMPDWTAWVNPLGWISQTRPADMDRWWPLLPVAALTLLLLAIAFALQVRRDFGQGAIAPEPGPSSGKLHGPWSLTLRLNRATAVIWVSAFVVLGTVFGYLSTSIDDLLGANPQVQAILAAGATSTAELTRSFIKTIMGMVGIIAAVAGVQVLLRVRSEEMQERVEPLLATPLTRVRYFAANVVTALALPALLSMVSGTMMALIAGSADTGINFNQAVLQAGLTVPAVWTATAVAVFVLGVRPQVSFAAWLGVLLSFALTLLGPTFRLPDWALGLSPFWHVPAVASAAPDASGLLEVSAVTAVLVLGGFVGFRRRDLGR